jgi:hypothetical protein
MAHPRTTILDAFAAALTGLPSVASVFETAATRVPIESVPCITIIPGSETIVAQAHVADGASIITQRRLRVHVVCHAKTREAADQIASEVEAAAPYASGIGAELAGSDFAEDGEGESTLFSTRVNFDVLYEAATGTA